ncbi:Yip1 family protein [Sphingomonas flavalba]|uniref:Yip1 family protein n=1 Tax=Sphingomonas flavalba TaxID=2559804 RepID=UPI00109DF87B|nr:Yip1 family protein [Sphingomonas flavalba]
MSAEFPGDQPVTHAGRAKRLLLAPAEEWRAIDAEPMTVGGIVKGWVLPLAAIGPVAGLIGGLVFGVSLLGITYRPSVGAALGTAIAGYIATVVGTIVLAYIIDALAPSFDGTKNRVQAMKVAAYSATAGWLAGIFQVVPALAWLGLLGLYSLYLLYVGLPLLMRAPAAKALGYTVVTVIAAVVLFVVVGMVATSVGRMLTPAPLIGAGAGGGSVSGTLAIPGVGTVDVGKMEAAARKMEAAADTPRTAVAPDVLQGLLPAALGDWKRTEIESSGANAGGLGGSRAEARYERGDDHFRLEVTDIAAVGALASLGTALNVQSNKQTATGYEKTGIVDGRMTTEEWDNESREGKYGVLVADRFMVEAEGNAPGIDTLKQAVAAIGIARLEGLAK